MYCTCTNSLLHGCVLLACVCRTLTQCLRHLGRATRKRVRPETDDATSPAVASTSSCDATPSNASASSSEETVSTPKAKSPKLARKSPGRSPSIEDIYLNKLWRAQMPKEKGWETIHEKPKL